jgi:hypothetical protein
VQFSDGRFKGNIAEFNEAFMLDRQSFKVALTPTAECLSMEQLEQLAAETAQNNAHLASCARCQAELAMLKSFQSDAHLADEGAAVAWISSQLVRRLGEIKGTARHAAKAGEPVTASWFARLSHFGKLPFFVPVTVAIAIIIAGAVLLRPSREPALQARLESSEPVLRSGEVETIAPLGELATPPAVLEWKAVPGAVRYKTSLMEVDRSPLWTTETYDKSVTIPNPVRGNLHPRKPVLWQVVALDAQGREIAASQLQRFVVVPRKNSEN